MILGNGLIEAHAAALASWWLSGGITAGQCAAAYAAKGAASLAASYINLNAPGTNDAAPGVAPTWDAAGGWTFNGTTQYLTTGIVPTATSWSLIVRYSDTLNTNTTGEAFNGGSQRFGFWTQASEIFYGNGGSLTVAPALLSGVVAIAGNGAYRNGVAEAGTIGAGTAPTRSIYIAGSNRGAGGESLWNGKIQAFAIYNITLSAGQVSSLTTAMNAL